MATRAATRDPNPDQPESQPQPSKRPTLEALALKYVEERKKAGRFRGGTPYTVRQTLLQFAEKVGPSLPAINLTRRKVDKWAAQLDVSPSTRRNRISLVRNFCRWMVANEHIRLDPTRQLESPRMPRAVPRGLKPDQIARLYAVLPDARAELIVSLMVQEGLRCIEVHNLQLGDVDLLENVLLVNGKGEHQRVLPISDETRAALSRYLHDHPASSGPLVRRYNHGGITSTHLPLRSATISMFMTRWMSEAGIKGRPHDGISAHALRHTAATDMLRSGAHLRDVQAALGHASLSTTQRYLPWVVGDLRTAMGGRAYKPSSSFSPAPSNRVSPPRDTPPHETLH